MKFQIRNSIYPKIQIKYSFGLDFSSDYEFIQIMHTPNPRRIIIIFHEAFFSKFICLLSEQGLDMLWYEARRLNIKIFFGALVLLAFGKAGRDISLRAFFVDQLQKNHGGI